MSGVVVRGWGAVSPAGWGVPALREALARNVPIATAELAPPCGKPFHVRSVPPPHPRPSFLTHPRLRRCSPIAHYAVAAALEALGPEALAPAQNHARLGIIYCAMAGCVNYSRRFYDETLKDPATASPLVFPETVFNSPASHLSALLGATTLNDTLVGDPATFLQGLALAADWLEDGLVNGCLVVAAEELDWLVAQALWLFSRRAIASAGAGAVYLCRATDTQSGVRLRTITSPVPYARDTTRSDAARRVRSQLTATAQDLLCDGLQDVPRLDRDEGQAWQDWPGPRLSPKRIFGEAFMAAAAWQCIGAVDAVARHQFPAATISVVGCNEQAAAAQFA